MLNEIETWPTVPAARPERAVMTITALLGVSTLVLLLAPFNAHHMVDGPRTAVFVLVVVGFVAAELGVFFLEYRRESIAFSLAEVPLAFALTFLSPPLAVLARLLGSSAAIARERPGPLKLVHNLALFAFETALAATVLHLLARAGGGGAMAIVLALTVGVAVCSMLGGVLVAVTVSFFEGNLAAKVATELRSGMGVWLLGSVIGATSVSVALLDVRLSLIPLGLVVAIWAGLRSYGSLDQHHRDLQEVHGFTGAVMRSLSLDDIAGAAVTEIRRLMRARYCALAVLGPSPDDEHRLVVGSGPLLPVIDGLDLSRVEEAADGHPAVIPPAVLQGLAPAGQDLSELVVTQVRDSHGPLAWLLVADRQGAHHTFSPADLQRLDSLAGQLAAALRNGVLHDQIEHQASHDRLTGLPNRLLFERAAQDAMSLGRADVVVGVLTVDIDRFKDVNDTLGHQVGDRLLIAVSERLAALLPADDVLARFAVDEFAILAVRPHPDELTRLASNVVAAVRRPFELGELTVVVTVSVGVSYAPEHAGDAPTLLRRADVAMYEAKARHSGSELYRPEIDRSGGHRLAMHGELRAMLEARQLGVHFQPKVDLATGTVVGVEALARWEHPTRGFVSPEEFIALAEQTGLIHQLTDQVLANALAAARQWQRRGAALGVAVNLSAHNLLDELLADRVARLLDRFAVDPGQLTLEITETSVMTEAERSLRNLDRLREMGVNLSVDDFGTGYSSLSYLRRLPVSEVKIDRSFVAELLLADQDEVIVRSTIDLGHNLGLQVVAEGVENEPVMARLRELGCDLAQGYGISRPLPLGKLDAWLRTAPYSVRRAGGWDPAHLDLT